MTITLKRWSIAVLKIGIGVITFYIGGIYLLAVLSEHIRN